MDHQDWTPVSWNKTGKQATETKEQYIKRQQRAGLPITTVIKPITNKSKELSSTSVSLKKLEAEDENFEHKKVTLSLAKNIARKRVEKGLTQKQLANALCLPETLIRDYEKVGSKIIPNPIVLNKIERLLGRVRD